LANYRSGFVTLLGRPNVGKSTLINKLIGEKITITSPIAQTTRNKLKGILTKDNGQIIFVDTPGVHKPHHRLGEILVKNAKSAINGVDMVIFVIDSSEEPGRGDEYILNFLIANKTEFIVALNKWDLVDKEFRNLRLDQYRRFFGINRNFQILSASQGEGCSELVDMILNFLPEGPKLYGEETICDQPLDNLLSDLSSTAEKFNMKHLLKPINKVLEEGNQSMKWINQYEKGLSIEQIMKISIEDMILNEDESI